MPQTTLPIPQGALVLYRGRPARVVRTGERLEIDLGDETLRVREKDVQLLHPGPLERMNQLTPLPGDMSTAWEILAGEPTTLAELAELAFGAYTPASSWAAWQFVADGLYFTGTPDALYAASREEMAQRMAERMAQADEAIAWQDFIVRAGRGERSPEDGRFYKEIEQLAYGSVKRSRALRDLGRAETPENAHALLLELGAWGYSVNPYPKRLNLPLIPPSLPFPDLPDEPRLDLTHLAAFAIDDAGSDTPDDAISLDGERIWVHVADPAALVAVDSPLDMEARGRAETLHLPEGHVHLFPPAITARLGLGLQPVSPALSFGIRLDDQGAIAVVEIMPSWVRVERLTYDSANERMLEAPFARLAEWMALRKSRRLAAGAVDIDLPEVKIHASDDGTVAIEPVPTLPSRRMVEEAMILTGEAVAKFASERAIPLPFSVQDAPDTRVPHDTLAGMFAMRKWMRRSQYRTMPAPHAGLGVPAYAQSTSPLRRYLDLLVHQQLRAFLAGRPLLGEGAVLERIGMVEAVLPALRQAEVLSEKHWTLVFLLGRPDWRGKAVLVDRRGSTGVYLLPELGLEVRASASGNLDDETQVEVTGINLANLEIYIRTAI